MTVVQTLLVFVGIPAAAILLIFLAVYGRTMMRPRNRYRPGRPWDYPPSWYVPHPDAIAGEPARTGSTTAVGGASGEW